MASAKKEKIDRKTWQVRHEFDFTAGRKVSPSHSHITAAQETSIYRWLNTGSQWSKTRPEMVPRKRKLAGEDDMATSKKSRSEIDPNLETEESVKSYGSNYYEVAAFLDHLWLAAGYWHDYDNDYNKDSKTAIKKLRKKIPEPPKGTPFDGDCYEKFLELMQARNKAMIIREMTPLMVPSPSGLLIRDKIKDNSLYDAIDEIWTSAIPILNARPKPDISVGFVIQAFTRAQVAKLEPTIGDDPSYYMGASRMYFPFLTCEVKASDGDINAAERQNALSMTMAIRGVAMLAQRANKQELIDKRVLAISIFHDATKASIDGYCPVYSKDRTKYTIRRSQLLKSLDLSNRWACYSFVRNIYELWAVEHLNLLRKLIDELPPKQPEDLEASPAEDPADEMNVDAV